MSEKILEFRGKWRNYQARVLKNADKYLKDGKMHIVAAPGSGKTTLGIEMIARLNQPTLILTPSITIREQWVARIRDAFLTEGHEVTDYISQNLKDPRWITVATYQSLHSAMVRFAGKLSGEEAEEKGDTDDAEGTVEEVDFSGFDLVTTMQDCKLGVICLDECHHLRSEWWESLERFKQSFTESKLIALTATPPYDSTPAMWSRYMEMCGDIDEEITIPELVKEGSLCAHQDYVYFNYPTEEESAEVEAFHQRAQKIYEEFLQDEELKAAICTHKIFTEEGGEDGLLKKDAYMSAFLIYLQHQQIDYPAKIRKGKVPAMKPMWLAELMQGFLYEDAESYLCDKAYREHVEAKLKQAGMIEKKEVSFTLNTKIEKLLTTSKGKANSIREIVRQEYQEMGADLRMLILTDYIRKEYESALGNPEKEVISLGVLPFFEQLRREHGGEDGLRLGVLCGTIVIIPAEAQEALLSAIGDMGKVNFTGIGQLEETDYVKVTAVGDAHFLTGAVTDIFTKGAFQVLIGTKSLLGEGWDSPCINSLILASFVGSYMLCNQMRGRAIRVFSQVPEKCSNIWHLVCLPPYEAENFQSQKAAWQEQEKEPSEICEDFALLERRMEHFWGLHDVEDRIEKGLARFSVIQPPYNQENVERINEQMLAMSRERLQLKQRWMRALANYKKAEEGEQIVVQDGQITNQVYQKKKNQTLAAGVATVGCIALAVSGVLGGVGILAGLAAVAGGVTTLAKLPGAKKLSTPQKRLQACAEGMRNALLQAHMLEDSRCKVVTGKKATGESMVYLSGGSSRDQKLFAQCVQQFFEGTGNPRYMLVNSQNSKGADAYYSVPDCFGKKAETAESFLSYVRPYIGEYRLVYTRNPAGKKELLQARVHKLSYGSSRRR